jgi:nicotinate-nucleotide adenylyltransferase
MHIALFFGSFNPIHVGHLIIAETILLEREIDQVWFVVSPQNPFKNPESLLSEHSRFYLTQIATEDNANFKVSNIEFSLPKPSYTIDTLNYLAEKYPEKKFSILIGGDNLSSFHKWKNYEKILANHRIYVYKRPAADLSQVIQHDNIHLLDVPLMEISSSLIRERIKNKRSIKYLVTENVEEEIVKGGFYK